VRPASKKTINRPQRYLQSQQQDELLVHSHFSLQQQPFAGAVGEAAKAMVVPMRSSALTAPRMVFFI
jgi:hypothetical protein